MIRPFLVLALVAVGATAVVAQADVNTQRKEFMKTLNRYGNTTLNGMARDRIPYDQAKVDEALAHIAEAAPKLPALFPAGGFQGPVESDSFYAAQKAFENQSDLKARSDKLAQDVAEAKGKIKDLASLKAIWPDIYDKDCNGCHKEYRAKKS